MLFTPTAMVIAQAILITPIIAALSRQVVADAWGEYREQLRSLGETQARRRVDAALGPALLAGHASCSPDSGAPPRKSAR